MNLRPLQRILPVVLALLAACVPLIAKPRPEIMAEPPTEAVVTPRATETAISLPGNSPTQDVHILPTGSILATPRQWSAVYVFPVQPAKLTSYAPGVQSHGYPAIDIFAPIGASFVAVTDGIVDFVSQEDLWNPAIDDPALRGGLSVAIIGRDGVRYYGSHLSEVEPGLRPGVQVQAGQLLGKIGRSGNARGKDSHLHFGISHPTFPGDWRVRRGEIDPFPYLQAWQNGTYITPQLPPRSPDDRPCRPGSRC